MYHSWKKWVTIKKKNGFCIEISSTLGKNNVLHLKIASHTCKNVTHLEKCATLGKMGLFLFDA